VTNQSTTLFGASCFHGKRKEGLRRVVSQLGLSARGMDEFKGIPGRMSKAYPRRNCRLVFIQAVARAFDGPEDVA
jgi:hypothetical protein